MIAAYLRGVDAIERLARHARMFLCMVEWSELETPGQDDILRKGLGELGQNVSVLAETMRTCLIEQIEIDSDEITSLWATIQS